MGKLDDYLQQLRENNTNLVLLKEELDSIISKNSEVITAIEKELSKRKSSMLPAAPVERQENQRPNKEESALKSICQLRSEVSNSPLIVRKPGWTSDFCMVVFDLNGDTATGKTYKCKPDGKADEKYKTTVSSTKKEYLILSENEEWIRRSVLLAVSEQESRSSHKESIDIERIGIGSAVLLLDGETNEEIGLEILPSTSEPFYKTMGYKSKNYVELIPSSEADGVRTISDMSPLGKALLDKQVGDIVSVYVDNKTYRYKVLSVNNMNS